MFIRPSSPEETPSSYRPHAARSHENLGDEAKSSGFTLTLKNARGESLFEVGRNLFTLVLLIAALLFAWFLAASTYLIYRDDVLMALFGQQQKIHLAYEDKISELRQKIDKITSKQFLTQESIEDRVAMLIARQAELEARQAMVQNVNLRAERSGLIMGNLGETKMTSSPVSSSHEAPLRVGNSPANAAAPARPRPLPETPNTRQNHKEPNTRVNLSAVSYKKQQPEQAVHKLNQRVGELENQQVASLNTLFETAQHKINYNKAIISDLGINLKRFGSPPASAPQTLAAATSPKTGIGGNKRKLPTQENAKENAKENAMGGPLLPLPSPAKMSESEAFYSAFQQTERMVRYAQNMEGMVRALPLGRPLPPDFDQTSPFGSRLDPFTRSFAFHAGLDFRAPTGTPIRAIAPGKITIAESMGGYGRVVEIDHGFGITTRYGHLSSFFVGEGERIKKGDVIGYAGSTGRSTGPHLHYEIRVDDEPIDPQRFMFYAASLGL